MRLSHDDWNQVSGFQSELYARTEAAAFRQTVLAGLLKLIPCEHASFNEINSRTNTVIMQMQPWVPEVFVLAPALEAHFHEHPQLNHYRQSADRQVYQTTDFFSLRQFRQKGIYQEFYRHLDTEHQLTCLLSDLGAVEDVGIGLNRKFKKFSERDRAVLNHLRPHLIQARHNAAAITQTEARAQALTHALDTVAAGLALVNATGRVTWSTPPVMRWLVLYFPHGRRHPERLPEDMERWLQAQRKALEQGTALATAPAAMVAHQQQCTLTVRFQAVAGGVTRLIFSEKRELLAAERARELGLTAREAEVMHWISEGKSNPEIAVLLRISPRTVHKHVEHILAKLNVETRHAAIRHVSAG
jgi:DNA-binding CsgD family transcriptional regulator